MGIEFEAHSPLETEEIPSSGAYPLRSLSREAVYVFDKSEGPFVSVIVEYGAHIDGIENAFNVPHRVLQVIAEAEDFVAGEHGVRVLGVCGDIPIKWKHLKALSHRGLEVSPAFRGQGIGSFMTALSDKISRRLSTEIGFRPSRLNLLMKQGFYPLKIYIPRVFNDIETEMRELEIAPKYIPTFIKLIQQYRVQEGEYDLPFAVELKRDGKAPTGEVDDNQLQYIAGLVRRLKEAQRCLREMDEAGEDDKNPEWMTPGKFHRTLSDLISG